VLVQGKRARLAGRVSMDMLTVDISECRMPAIGSPVTLWGDGLPVDEVAARAERSATSSVRDHGARAVHREQRRRSTSI
jgi:alanine racemase